MEEVKKQYLYQWRANIPLHGSITSAAKSQVIHYHEPMQSSQHVDPSKTCAGGYRADNCDQSYGIAPRSGSLSGRCEALTHRKSCYGGDSKSIEIIGQPISSFSQSTLMVSRDRYLIPCTERPASSASMMTLASRARQIEKRTTKSAMR